MNITNAIKELKETWGYETEELNHIRDLLEEVAADTYRIGYEDGKIDSENRNVFTSYGKSEDWLN
jgi:hypothetical protein